jgi:hypothetical protein
MHGQIGGGNSGPDVIPFASTKSTSRIGIADKPASDACFNDWKRFCFVLREIASGENGCPLSALEAQKQAQAVAKRHHVQRVAMIRSHVSIASVLL